MTDRRGVALVLVLAATVLVGSLSLLALHGAAIRVRLLADARWRTEGSLVAASALAATRIAQDSALAGIADGALLNFPTVVRPDGWQWTASAARSGAVIRIAVLGCDLANFGIVQS